MYVCEDIVRNTLIASPKSEDQLSFANVSGRVSIWPAEVFFQQKNRQLIRVILEPAGRGESERAYEGVPDFVV